MRILLDTHIYIWALAGDRRLKKHARKLILDAETVFVSVASLWEAAIKVSLGKLDADVELLASNIEPSGFLELPIRARHAVQTRLLPLIHRDPFDRMLVAQAICEPLRLVTVDADLARYTNLVIKV
jgi:PIN domain nuclease of toxin-antitoxin system